MNNAACFKMLKKECFTGAIRACKQPESGLRHFTLFLFSQMA
jgi:hypothetical protein